jgi:predicted transcriptional regulator
MVALREAVEILETTARPKHGVRPSFSSAEVMLALMTIDEEGSVGRPSLMKALNLHEAQVKTLIKRLKELGLVSSHRLLGLSLTNRGKEVVSALKDVLSVKKDCVLVETLGWKVAAAVIRGGGSLLTKVKVSELRDLGVSEGAKGVLILVKEGGELVMPPKALNETEEVKAIRRELSQKFELGENDLLVLVEPCDKVIQARVLLSYVKLL